MPITVAITDDHPLAIVGLQNMLHRVKEILVSNTYLNGETLLNGLKRQQPDVLLLDILLPDMKAQDIAEEIHKNYPSIKIIAITSLDAPVHIKTMIRHGCKGYLLKNTDVKTLVHAIKQVYEGQEFIEASLKEQMLLNMLNYKKQATVKIPSLTRREKEILELIIEENTNQQIADKLCLSLRTVENHRFSLQQKLDVKNTVGLVKAAIQMGLVQ